MATSYKRVGAAIAILAAIFAVLGMAIFHLSIAIACSIAVLGIVIGTGVTRGKFSRPPDASK